MRAAELFEAYGCRATFFITSDRALKKARYLREPEICELRKRHFSIGAHGATHRKLTFLSESACIEELERSKRWLEQVLGEEVRYMAAPGGYVNARVLQLACDQGYVLTGTCSEWMNSISTMCLPGTVNRVNIRQRFSLEVFRRVVEGKPGVLFRPPSPGCRSVGSETSVTCFHRLVVPDNLWKIEKWNKKRVGTTDGRIILFLVSASQSMTALSRPSHARRIVQSTGIVMAAILLSRLLGFLREWTVAHQIGSGR
jgi:hypothetical protein